MEKLRIVSHNNGFYNKCCTDNYKWSFQIKSFSLVLDVRSIIIKTTEQISDPFCTAKQKTNQVWFRKSLCSFFGSLRVSIFYNISFHNVSMTIQEFDEKHKEEKKKKPSSSKKEGGSTSKANKSQEAAQEEDEDTRLRGFDRGLQVLLKSWSKYSCNNALLFSSVY